MALAQRGVRGDDVVEGWDVRGGMKSMSDP